MGTDQAPRADQAPLPRQCPEDLQYVCHAEICKSLHLEDGNI